jgi:hypothetical protein
MNAGANTNLETVEIHFEEDDGSGYQSISLTIEETETFIAQCQWALHEAKAQREERLAANAVDRNEK